MTQYTNELNFYNKGATPDASKASYVDVAMSLVDFSTHFQKSKINSSENIGLYIDKQTKKYESTTNSILDCDDVTNEEVAEEAEKSSLSESLIVAATGGAFIGGLTGQPIVSFTVSIACVIMILYKKFSDIA